MIVALDSIEQPRSGVVLYRNLETMKWLGLIAMMVDHVNVYAMGAAYPFCEFVGSLAFPFFVMAFAGGMARRESFAYGDIGWRLILFGLLAMLFAGLVRDFIPLNILFTFAFGLTLADCIGEREWLTALAILVLGIVVEYSVFGVVLVALAVYTARKPRGWHNVLPLLLFPFLVPFNSGNHMAIVAVCALPLLNLIPFDLPRFRGAFYWIYALQFPVLWALDRVV